MEDQQLRENLATELRRQGLPRAYIQRLLEEWEDHIADLQDERNADMSHQRKLELAASAAERPKLESAHVLNLQERLGDPVQLADLAANQYHHRSFLGRHPILTFLVLPVPLMALQIVGTMCALFLLGNVINLGGLVEGFNEQDHPVLGSILLGVFSWTILVLPPLFAALLMCRVARKNNLNLRWSAAGCVLVALYCAMFFVSWRLATAPGNGTFMLGFGFDSDWNWIVRSFLPKFALALGIGLFLIRRAQRLQDIDDGHDASPPLLRRAA